MREWVELLGEKFESSEVEEMLCVAWNIWNIRNKFVFGEFER